MGICVITTNKSNQMFDYDAMIMKGEKLLNWEYPKVCVNLQTDVR